MTAYLLDTNHVSALLDGAPGIRERLEIIAPDNQFGITTPILGELYFRAYASQRRQENLDQLADFVARVLVWEYDHAAAQEFGRVQAEQKHKGRPIPAIDAQIAAVARVHHLTILTADRHFSFVDHLLVENWLDQGRT